MFRCRSDRSNAPGKAESQDEHEAAAEEEQTSQGGSWYRSKFFFYKYFTLGVTGSTFIFTLKIRRVGRKSKHTEEKKK
jgi:hypothetical protein